MVSSTSVSLGLALLVGVPAGAFVQAPARCAVTQQAASRARGSTSTSPLCLLKQRPRPLVSSYTTLFSEGEDTSPAAASAEGSGEPNAAAAAAGDGAEVAVVEEKPLTEAELAQKAKMEEIERLRAKEKFTTVKTGDHECLQCGFVYKPENAGQGALPGTQFDDLPSTWICPVCKAPKDTFFAQTKTIAGFEDNANYGFGANQMTGSQKNLLIFGSLFAFFVLFLAGYALD
ncbi:unnamed protein product [Ectocarpus sp. 13 AM-2016]